MMSKYLISRDNGKRSWATASLQIQRDQLRLSGFLEGWHYFATGLAKDRREYTYLTKRNGKRMSRRDNHTLSFGETITVDVANFNGEHTSESQPRGSISSMTRW